MHCSGAGVTVRCTGFFAANIRTAGGFYGVCTGGIRYPEVAHRQDRGAWLHAWRNDVFMLVDNIHIRSKDSFIVGSGRFWQIQQNRWISVN